MMANPAICIRSLGKQYRIAKRDLEAFVGKSVDRDSDKKPPVPPEVSTIVQVDGVDVEKADRIARMITAAAKGHKDDRPLRVNVLHDPEQKRLKVVILGSIEATTVMLELIRHYTEQ